MTEMNNFQLDRTKGVDDGGSGRNHSETGSNLNSPEVSVNLQHLIQTDAHHGNNSGIHSSNHLTMDESISVFSDLLNETRVSTSRLSLGAQNHHNILLRQAQSQNLDNQAENHNMTPFSLTDPQNRLLQNPYSPEQVGEPTIKQEPSEEQVDYSSSCSRSSAYSPGPSGSRYSTFSPDDAGMGQFGPNSPSLMSERGLQNLRSKSGSKMSKKNLDKGSDEYKKRRERNNIAVRKSREKAKQRSRETEKKVSELQRANETLHKQIGMLHQELDVVKKMLSQAGIHPSTIEAEIQNCLGEFHHRHGALLGTNS